MSIKARLLKRLEDAEKKIIPKKINVIVFIEETKEAGIYKVQQNLYYGADSIKKDSIDQWNVKASNAQEIADNYKAPNGCNEPLIFMYDFGVEKDET